MEKDSTANSKVVAEKVTRSVDKEVQEDFHEFLRAHTEILIKKRLFNKR